MNCGYVQVEIGTVKDNFWTVQVEFGTVQDANLAKSGAIFGQYMVIFSTKKVEFWVLTSQNWDSTRQFLDSTSWNWDSTRHQFDKFR